MLKLFNTGNGTGTKEEPWSGTVSAPDAPSLICLNKNSGKALWSDHSPGTNILQGQWGSPLVIEVNGRGQVIAPEGDGWVRSFDALTGELLWKLDINPKSARRVDRNHFMNAPVFYENRIYLAGGLDYGAGEGRGRLFCIDPTKRGDLSLELDDGPGKGKPNPNSGVIWSFGEFNRTGSLIAVHDGLVIALDFTGYAYCLDARSGQRFWRHDLKANSFASPLIVDGKAYLSTEDGEVFIFELSKEKKLIAKHDMGGFLASSPIFANGVLYIADSEYLYAIQEGHNTLLSPKTKPTPQ